MKNSALAVLFRCLVEIGFGMASQQQLDFTLDSTDCRLPDYFATYETISTVTCAFMCAFSPTTACSGVSYNDGTQTCTLSTDTGNKDCSAGSSGWSLYKEAADIPAEYLCNEYNSYPAGSLLICRKDVSQFTALEVCESYGRLLEIRTESMWSETSDFLNSIATEIDRPLWVSGKYTDTWRFPDGQLMPVTETTAFGMTGVAGFINVILNKNANFKFNHMSPTNWLWFICEKL